MQPALAVLRDEGLFEPVAVSNEPSTHFCFRDAATDSVIRSIDLGARYGEPYYTVRRADVAKGLLEALPGAPPVCSVDVVGAVEDKEEGQHTGKMRLEIRDGTVLPEAFDAVVAANSIDSSLRAHVLGSDLVRAESP